MPKILSHFDTTIQVNGPYFNKTQNRYFVRYLFPDKTKRVITYAKYLMEQHLKRTLSNTETVDHIDRNKTNDVIENLQILNLPEHAKLDAKYVNLVEITCVLCNKKAFKQPKNIKHNSKQGKAGPFCSKSCCGKYGRKLQLNQIKEFSIQPTVESTYYFKDKN
jgi:hypothetical protein